MRIALLCRVTLAALLGLGWAGASSAAAPAGPTGQKCPNDSSYESRAVQLAKCNGGFADLQRLAGVYQRELGLSAESAARLAGVIAAQQALEREGGPERAEAEPEIRRIESEFILLLKKAPDDAGIADEASWFYSRWSSNTWRPAPALLDLVARAADPATLAFRLTRRIYSVASTEILLAALAVRPESAALWHQAAQDVYDPAWKIAFLEEAHRLAAGEDVAAVALAEELLAAQLQQGLVPRALATFQSLAPAARARIERGSGGKIQAELGGHPFESNPRDLRLSLAAAYLLAGDTREASRLLAKITPAPATAKKGDPDVNAGEIERRALARWLHPSPDDPFDLLTSALTGSSVGIGTLALARLAERERYPAVAVYCLDLLDRGGQEPPFEPSRGVSVRVRASADSTRGEIEKLSQSLADEARADREAARTVLGPDPAAATVGRLLKASAAARFAERPLPEGTAPVELADDQVEKRQKAMAAGVKLPSGFAMIRVERQGDRAAALGVSQDYDPVGEVSSGAYWVILSSDGGRTWDPPLYTGLRVNQPYVTRAVSDLPLLAGDHLQVEVEIAELDPSTITFPPVALAPKRTAKGLYLDIPLDLLRRDTDGDGLTDLAEERLLTDPESRDTDGDGLEDAVDPLPTIPLRREAPSAMARALAAFLGDTWKADRAALIEGIAEGPRVLSRAKGGTRSTDEKTLFLIAERSLFSALQPRTRVVVLTAEEADAAGKKFGPFYPQSLELFFFDRSGRRAYVVWSASWQGGQTLLEEGSDGTWKATPRMNWIT